MSVTPAGKGVTGMIGVTLALILECAGPSERMVGSATVMSSVCPAVVRRTRLVSPVVPWIPVTTSIVPMERNAMLENAIPSNLAIGTIAAKTSFATMDNAGTNVPTDRSVMTMTSAYRGAVIKIKTATSVLPVLL